MVMVRSCISLGACMLYLLAGSPGASAAPITFQNGTATFTQPCDGSDRRPDASVDGVTTGTNGWAIATTCATPVDSTQDQIAVWETTADFTASQLDFALTQVFGVQHILGRFRLSVTSDDRSLFADDLDNGGDVTANWIVLTNPTASGGGLTFTTQPDGSILVSGAVPSTATYAVSYTGSFLDITGVRLEVLEDSSLPYGGPGLASYNGNFVLTELALDASGVPAVPEPATLALLAFGLGGLAFRRRGARIEALAAAK